ncbi:NmrA family NAD(P)-binding protein [Pseudomonas petrae]|nr:NmrA family NAD(P)-binding protein [Pseudomonas petrae]MCF7539614.1 NmrA family NAD(P)-binding protein [Pseudomonas petrae]
MGKILVTGATGRLGNAVVHALVQRGDAGDVVGLARDPVKAQPLTSLGIEVRYGDYTDYDALVSAFQGVEKIYMVSAVAFSDRIAQHKNVIDAARRAGVGHVMYTGIQRLDDVLCPIEGVTDSDIATENLLKQSGLGYTVLRHPLYANDLPMFIGPNAINAGFAAPAGNGRIALACYQELAEAGAVLLRQSAHDNRSYLLNSGSLWSFADIANALSGLAGKAVSYEPISSAAFLQAR